MALIHKLTAFKLQYAYVEDLSCTFHTLPKLDKLKEMIPDWNETKLVYHRGYKLIYVARDPDLNYYLFNYSNELSEYFLGEEK